MGIEEQIDRLIDLGEEIKSRLDRLVDAASDHFADANKMVADEPAKEASLDGLPDIRTFAQPNLRWRILEPGEVVQEGDWVNAKDNKPDEDPPGGGWMPAVASVIGGEASQAMGLYVARPVADEPAKEPEHPAGPKPDPGEGYRLLSKDPEESLHLGDEYELAPGRWVKSENAGWTRMQDPAIWYRRKIEPAEPLPAWEPKVGDWVKVTRPGDWTEWEHPTWQGEMHEFDGRVGQIERESGDCFQVCGFAAPNGFCWQFHRDWLSPAEPPEPEYREPVLPQDAGKPCEFSDDGSKWHSGSLYGWTQFTRQWVSGSHQKKWRHCRIQKDA